MPKCAWSWKPFDIRQVKQVDHHAARRVKLFAWFGKAVKLMTQLFTIIFLRREQAAIINSARYFRVPVAARGRDEELDRAIIPQPSHHFWAVCKISVNDCTISAVADDV